MNVHIIKFYEKNNLIAARFKDNLLLSFGRENHSRANKDKTLITNYRPTITIQPLDLNLETFDTP